MGVWVRNQGGWRHVPLLLWTKWVTWYQSAYSLCHVTTHLVSPSSNTSLVSCPPPISNVISLLQGVWAAWTAESAGKNAGVRAGHVMWSEWFDNWGVFGVEQTEKDGNFFSYFWRLLDSFCWRNCPFRSNCKIAQNERIVVIGVLQVTWPRLLAWFIKYFIALVLSRGLWRDYQYLTCTLRHGKSSKKKKKTLKKIHFLWCSNTILSIEIGSCVSEVQTGAFWAT